MVSLYENATHLIVTGEPSELKQLSDEMRFRPDGYYFVDAYTRYRVTGGTDGWDGYSYPFKIIGTAAKCLRGRRDQIVSLCHQFKFELNTKKLLPSPFATLHIEDVRPDLITADFQLDDAQRRSIQQWLVHGIGICHVTVGGGKTATFAGAAALIKEHYPKGRIIYITPSERLVRQAYKDLTGFLPHMDVTQFGGGKKNESGKDIVVCTTAMVYRHFDRLKREKWFETFLAIFYDEVHHAPSDSSQKVLMAIPAFFRLGATDSIREGDEERQGAMIGLFGMVRNTVESHELMRQTEDDESARLASPHIYLVDIKSWRNKFIDIGPTPALNTSAFSLIDGEWKKGTYLGPVYALDRFGKQVMKKRRTLDEENKWITVVEPVTEPGLHLIEIDGEARKIESRWVLLNRMYDRAITRFSERNEIIVQWVKHYSAKLIKIGDGGCLVVCTRTLHIYILEALLKQEMDENLVRILFSKDTSVQRDECFEWFKKTPGAVLISPLAKEGVSINQIRCGVIADYFADFDAAKQVIGRFIRPKAKGDNRAEITAFIENQCPTYRRGSAALYRSLERVRGFTFYHPVEGPESVENSSVVTSDENARFST